MRKKSGRATPRDLETPFGQTIDKASAVAGYMDGTTKISSKSVDALRSWLNCTAMKSPIVHIPRDFVNSNGKILIELIETLTGRNVPESHEIISKQERAPQQLLKQYEECLAHLKGHGSATEPYKT